MAAPPPRATHPGRTLVIFLVTLLALGGIMFLVDRSPTPNLGLDLRGGTSITLTARQSSGGDVTPEALQTAVEIIRARVDGTGVAESEVTTQGSTTIVVSVPGVGVDELIELVGTTAELRFRQVLAVDSGIPVPEPTVTPTGTTDPSASPTGTPTETPTGTGTTAPTTPSTTAPTDSPATTSPASTSGSTSSPASVAAPYGSGVPLAAGTTGTTTTPPSTTAPTSVPPTTTTPPTEPRAPPEDDETGLAAAQAAYAELDCSLPESVLGGSTDDPELHLATCDQDGTLKYLLAPATILGPDLTGATAGIPQNSIGDWQVNLEFTSEGRSEFATMTAQMAPLAPAQFGAPPTPTNQFAIVLDGLVVSAPEVNEPIPGGQAQITGNFTQAEATDLANTLKYGALPLAFETSDVSEVTPTLGADSLRAGLIAGMIGLGLVLVYAMFYYRALGAVVVGSLVVAAAGTYVAVVLLSEWIGFTLTLAGVAGLIVAIGVTADSFIIYFERIRDEVREGRTLRAAIEHGWVRARRTIIAADVVSLLSAVVLYIVSIGNVRGFAFALGLSTVIDVIIVFLFTKPLLSWLGGKQFFGEGSRWSGLSGDRLGQRARSEATTTRRARSARPAAEEA